MQHPTVIDLFCGCGGFGLGAELAGFRSIAAIDVDRDLQSSYRLNFPGTRVVEADISKIDSDCWSDIIGSERPDGIIGGPPCQGFSAIGKRDKNDIRNQLVSHFFRQINILRPKFFVMENVEGILSAYGREMIESSIENLLHPYTILEPQVIDAAKFGAATRRRRAILVGYLPDEMAPIDPVKLFETKGIPQANVRRAIQDLPTPEPQSVENGFGYRDYPMSKSVKTKYASTARKQAPNHLGWKLAKDWHEKGKISGFHQTIHTDAVKERFSKTPPGSVDKISKYPKLDWNGVSPTLRAGTGKERGSFQAVRPIHPDDPRVITVREAARIQGFPDWFVFHPTMWHSFRMIGNSVSPYVSFRLLNRIRECL